MPNTDEELPPKNYINSGISKSLLTPCRRVGLSRTKKTPSTTPNISPSPRISDTPLTIGGGPNITDSIDSRNTPKRCLILQSDKYLDVTPVKNIIGDNYSQTTHLKDTFSNCRRLGLSRTKTTPKDIENLSPQTQIVGDVNGVSSIVTKNVKRCLNLRLHEADPKIEKNIGECQQNIHVLKPSGKKQGVIENPVRSTFIKDELPYKLPPDVDSDTNILISNSPVHIEPDSPPESPVFSEVSVLVHHPTTRNHVNSIVTDKLKDQPRDLIEEKNQEILEETNLIVKSKELKLDSVNFETNENNESMTVKNDIFMKIQANCSSMKELPKSCCNRFNESSKLTRFTTEDYLEEYSKNPYTFKDSSGTGNAKNILTRIDDSDSDDFQPLKIPRTNKINNKNCTEKRGSKNYMAILCPLSENSGIGQSAQDLSESLFKVNSTSAKNLSVSLERLSNKSIEDNGKISDRNEDNNFFTQGKAIVSKPTFPTDDSDDEMFTSSPESNRKHRENLVQLISTMKQEIKQKEETLERLKQAQAYKKMHNIEELSRLTNRWIVGCKNGLKDLLIKLQEHGPMEMDILMKNLMIPNDTVNKLKLL